MKISKQNYNDKVLQYVLMILFADVKLIFKQINHVIIIVLFVCKMQASFQYLIQNVCIIHFKLKRGICYCYSNAKTLKKTKKLEIISKYYKHILIIILCWTKYKLEEKQKKSITLNL